MAVPLESSPESTLAVILGASEFPNLGIQSDNAFLAAAEAFTAYLQDSVGYGLPEKNLHSCFNFNRGTDALYQSIGDFAKARIEDLRSHGHDVADVLIYYAGHGYVDSQQRYHLALCSTRLINYEYTSLTVEAVFREFTGVSNQIRLFLILDACFAGEVLKQFQAISVIDPLARQLREEPSRGSAVLCSSPPDLASLVLPDHSNTQFTSALMDVLRNGSSQHRRRLNLNEVRDLVHSWLIAKYGTKAVRPEIRPIKQQEGDISTSVRLFPNPSVNSRRLLWRNMPNKRLALLIANAEYQHPELQKLNTPTHHDDVRTLETLLTRPDIGGYQALVLIDRTKGAIERAIDQTLTDSEREDTVLVFFAGHGFQDGSGNLYFAAVDTEPEYLAATAVSAGWLTKQMRDSYAGRLIVLLDCCFGAAFARRKAWRDRSVKSDEGLHVPDLELEGRGQVVITSSDAMHFAFEGGALDGRPPFSHFTRALTEGLASGEADCDGDGRITVDELMNYLVGKLRILGSPHRPTKWTFGAIGGDLLFGYNPRANVAVGFDHRAEKDPEKKERSEREGLREEVWR
jgi:uncharacterized caspase-like protein